MDEWVIPIIKDIEEERRVGGRSPICAPFMEIQARCTPEQRKSLRVALNNLYVDGKINVWRSINDRVVQLK